MAAPDPRADRGLRRPALCRAERRAPAVVVPQLRLRDRGCRLAHRLCRFRDLHEQVRLLQQGVGSLSAVVVMLTWLWLSSLALLVGAEVNAEAGRSRGLRRGEPADEQLTASTRA